MNHTDNGTSRHLAHAFAEVVAAHPERIATRIHRGGVWETQTYAEFDAAIDRLARGLIQHGVDVGDRVALLSQNRPEWSLVDFACARIGAVSVPLYPSSTAEQVAHIVAHSDARVVIADTEKALAKFDGLDVDVRATLDAGPLSIDTWECDAPGLDEVLTSRLAAAHADDLLTIIYTSGTTGVPKGVMLAHGAFTAELASLDEFFTITPDDHSLAFLPLSHALERAWTYCVLLHGCQNTYLADPSKVAQALIDVQPTLLVSVPRLFEKVYSTAHEKVAGSKVKQQILKWALRVGGRVQRAHRVGATPSLWWQLQLPLANKLVFSSLRAAIGGPKTVLASGGAPLRREIEEFLSSAGVLVCQGYGLTEAGPLVSFNAPGAFKFGTVGRVIDGGEIRIADNGEILYRGPNVMRGYWLDDEATSSVLDADGWLHTGDIGLIDDDGFLVITDRIKDLLVTSGGKNVAPQPIEGLVLADPLFEYAVLLGDNRPFLTLLVQPSLPQLEDIARQMQISWSHRDELFTNPQIVDYVKARVAALTEKLPHHEQIKDLRVMLEEFTQEAGLLTPTLKVRRREVEKRFAALIEDMYAKAAELRKKLG